MLDLGSMLDTQMGGSRLDARRSMFDDFRNACGCPSSHALRASKSVLNFKAPSTFLFFEKFSKGAHPEDLYFSIYSRFPDLADGSVSKS